MLFPEQLLVRWVSSCLIRWVKAILNLMFDWHWHHKRNCNPNAQKLYAIADKLESIRRHFMATAQQALDAANAALNSYQSLSNSVSAQLAEQSTVLSDYADHLKNGSSPDPAILDTVVQQMGNLKKSVDETN